MAATADALERLFARSRGQLLCSANGGAEEKDEEEPRQQPIQGVRLVTPSALFRVNQELARSCRFSFLCCSPGSLRQTLSRVSTLIYDHARRVIVKVQTR
jgi:hypothetical protein